MKSDFEERRESRKVMCKERGLEIWSMAPMLTTLDQNRAKILACNVKRL
jgi:hypothetical protein